SGTGREGMGTTCTALLLRDGQCAIAHVGDSRAYLLRDGRLSQLTHDHSVVGALLRSGHLTAAEARVHPQRNVITRALGSESEVTVDTHLIPVLSKDRLLICSDGLVTMIEDTYIQHILTTHEDPMLATQALIDAANEAGGKDNISCIVIDITREGSASRHVPTRSKLWRWITVWMTLSALILSGIGYGVYRYAQTKAYLAPSEHGTVNVYKGIPGHIFGISLNSLSKETTVVIESLNVGDQEKINTNISYDSVEHAKSALEQMTRYAHPEDKVPKTPTRTP
ncbi:MAG: protein phosphatase 2C domain-containing protein, partial [Coriobacteriia bacterium]|nr:protein phosphatase 2C domain-containing protein [Coriobacteriia bacterium]